MAPPECAGFGNADYTFLDTVSVQKYCAGSAVARFASFGATGPSWARFASYSATGCDRSLGSSAQRERAERVRHARGAGRRGRVVRGGLIQVKADVSLEGTAGEIKQRMLDKHLPLIDEAARRGVQVLCLQELFNGPYFCAEQQVRWYEMVERIPDGPTIQTMQ